MNHLNTQCDSIKTEELSSGALDVIYDHLPDSAVPMDKTELLNRCHNLSFSLNASLKENKSLFNLWVGTIIYFLLVVPTANVALLELRPDIAELWGWLFPIVCTSVLLSLSLVVFTLYSLAAEHLFPRIKWPT